ncbi:MAG: sugar ABC transporter permease [Anaerolineae bacterium]|nr:sugar ABC transporter permease [Anaerolineae bacterium]
MTSQVAVTSSVQPQPRTRPLSQLQRQRVWGWVFLSPWIVGFFLFTFFPIVASLIFSFTEFSITNGEPIKWVGLQNWSKLFTDPLALTAMNVTVRLMLMSIPFAILIPLGMATLLNSKALAGKPLFRALFYLPYMVPVISSIFIWQAFLNGQTGYLARLLRLVGIEGPNWVYDPNWVLPAIILIGVWGVGNAMLTMLATMSGVPSELYEAAKVDGANAITSWLKITLPMISPVIFYNLVLSVIGLMQIFAVPYVLTLNTGRANEAIYVYNVHLYKTAFQYGDMGYAAALAWFMFLVALVMTIILFATSRNWVYYAGGEN